MDRYQILKEPSTRPTGDKVNGFRAFPVECPLSVTCIMRFDIAQCRNVRALERVSYIDRIESLNISTEMLMNEKLPSQV